MQLFRTLLLWLVAGTSVADQYNEKFQAVIDGAVQKGVPAVDAAVTWPDHTWAGCFFRQRW